MKFGEHQSDEAKQKNSESHKLIVGWKHSINTRYKMSLSHRGKQQTPEHIKHIVEARRRNGTYGHTELTKQKMSLSHKGKIFSETHKKNISLAKIGVARLLPLETINKIKIICRLKSLELWKNPKYRANVINGVRTAYQKRTLKFLRKRPTRIESLFIDFFARCNLPFSYCGSGQLLINSKCPDFRESNGKMFIIEVGSREEKAWRHGSWQRYVFNRVTYFKNVGYLCLVLFEDELINENELVFKVKTFLGVENVEYFNSIA